MKTGTKKNISKKQQAMNLLKRCDKKGIGWLYDNGLEFFNKHFYPNLNFLEKVANTKEEIEILADSFYLLGDIYDFHNAPKAAIRAYKKGIMYFPYPDYASGYDREIGVMLNAIGKYNLATRHFNKALKTHPQDEVIKDEIEFNEIDKKEFRTPLYKIGDWKWEVNELLANNKPQLALKKIPIKRSVQACLMKVRCFGALEDADSQLQEWEIIKRLKGKMEVEYADLFFMKTDLYKNLRFWEILNAIKLRLQESGKFLAPWHFHDTYPKRNWRTLDSDFIAFKIAKLSKDGNKLTKLKNQYPKWKELH
jgi:tetratricopeptide (TPR) repeat protein